MSEYRLDIDIHRNEPCVHAAAQVPNTGKWRGSQLSVTILGNWQYYRAKARGWGELGSAIVLA